VAARTWLTAHRTLPAGSGDETRDSASLPSVAVRQAQDAWDALLLLDRYGLVTIDGQAGHRAVRVHALTARAACEISTVEQTAAAVRVAADALLELWPDTHHDQPDLTAVLGANATILASHDTQAGDVLWTRDGAHTLLWRAGLSLLQAGLHGSAVAHWEHVSTTALRILGPEHPATLDVRANLASSYRQAGRTTEAITIEEQVVAASVRILGPEHQSTLAAHVNLAVSYWQAGRTTEAITLVEQVAADAVRILGPEHPFTLAVQANLASSYGQIGRTDDVITLVEQVAADRARILGPEHPSTLAARAGLASSYRQAGRTTEAITLEEKVAADAVRILGPEHPDTRAVVAALQQWKNEG
jgi:hypothetical protein